MASDAADPALIRQMIADIQRSERLVTQRAAELCEIGSSTVPFIVEHLDASSDPLIDVLASMGDTAARAALPRLLEFVSNPSHEAWSFAIRGLIALDDNAYPDTAVQLVRCIRDATPDAGRGLVHVIHKTGDAYRESVCDALSRWLTSDDPTLRAEGAQWLSGLAEREQSEPRLRELLEDPNEDVRFAAMQCLAQLDLDPASDADVDPMASAASEPAA